jgi:hypothetical protein
MLMSINSGPHAAIALMDAELLVAVEKIPTSDRLFDNPTEYVDGLLLRQMLEEWLVLYPTDIDVVLNVEMPYKTIGMPMDVKDHTNFGIVSGVLMSMGFDVKIIKQLGYQAHLGFSHRRAKEVRHYVSNLWPDLSESFKNTTDFCKAEAAIMGLHIEQNLYET